MLYRWGGGGVFSCLFVVCVVCVVVGDGGSAVCWFGLVLVGVLRGWFDPDLLRSSLIDRVHIEAFSDRCIGGVLASNDICSTPGVIIFLFDEALAIELRLRKSC